MKDSPCILIVDDEQGEVALLAEFMKKSGYKVSLAGDGFKALAACKVRVPDVILLDLQMPLMKGIDVCNKLQADEKTKNIPVIFLRTVEESGIIQPAFSEYPVLVKPLEAQDALSLVKTVLRERALKEELRKKERQVKELTLTDALTSCRNMHYLNEFLKTELTQASRYVSDFSLLVLEPDQHKDLLKKYGQKGVDSLLVQLVAILVRNSRKADLLARSGNVEFVLAMPFTKAEGAIEVAERIREDVAQSSFTFDEQNVPLSISIGIAQFRGGMDSGGELLLSYARQALAQARSAGGNRSFMAE
ncbi:MAG: diguanylate cyclase [Candidatus Obscuribacterales bacterium]|nr:diguanylate cyclase [Candidatus Obscuribacterales bacterium]